MSLRRSTLSVFGSAIMARRLQRLAIQQFLKGKQRGYDPVSVVLGAVRLATLEARARNPSRLRLALERADRTLRAGGIAVVQAMWPSTGAVDAFFADQAPSKLESAKSAFSKLAPAELPPRLLLPEQLLAPDGKVTLWQPWILRLLCAQAHTQPEAVRRSSLELIRTWVGKEYAVLRGKETLLSREFSWSLLHEEGTVEAALMRTWRFLAHHTEVLSMVFSLLAAGLIFWGFCVGWRWLVRLVGERLLGSTPSNWQIVLWTMGLIMVAGIMPSLMKAFARWLSRYLTVEANLVARAWVADRIRPWLSEAGLTVHYTLRFSEAIMLKWPAAINMTKPIKALTRYRDATELIPSSRWLLRFAKRTTLSPVECVLSIDEALAGTPWEAAFGCLPPPASTPASFPLIFRRKLPSQTKARLEPLQRQATVLVHASDLALQEALTLGWDEIEDIETKASAAMNRDRLRTVSPVIAHLVGIARERQGDIRFHLDQLQEVYQSSSEDAPREAGVSYSAAELSAAAPDLRVVILQSASTPQDTRTEVQYAEAALLRRLGAEMFLCGIPAVLTLPAMSAELTGAVVWALRDVLERGQRGQHRAWLNMFRQVQRTLRRPNPSLDESKVTEADLERPYDACFYMVDHFGLAIATAPEKL